MKLEHIQKAGVLGGGVMGGGIAQTLAIAGYPVVVRDISDDAIAATRQAVFDSKWGMKKSVELGKLGFDDCVAAMERISFTQDIADIADCDIIIEAVPENLELKQEVFKELDGVAKEGAIFASNTSGFVIAEVARDVSDARKKDFVGMHYSNPVTTMKMCEVIYTNETSEESTQAARGIAEASGKVVSMVKDTPETYGFLLNRIFGAAAREARTIVEQGIATGEDVDKAMMTGRNWPSGFFGTRGGIGKEW